MSSLRIGQAPFFERGIESVVTGQEHQPPRLPDGRLLPPSHQPAPSALDQLLHVPTLEALLDQAIEPEPPDARLLLPAGFDAARRSIRARMAARLAEWQDSAPAQAKVIQRADRLLREQEQLWEQAQRNWYALLQG